MVDASTHKNKAERNARVCAARNPHRSEDRLTAVELARPSRGCASRFRLLCGGTTTTVDWCSPAWWSHRTGGRAAQDFVGVRMIVPKQRTRFLPPSVVGVQVVCLVLWRSPNFAMCSSCACPLFFRAFLFFGMRCTRLCRCARGSDRREERS